MAQKKQKSSVGTLIGAMVLPLMLVIAWIFALSGSAAPGIVAGEPTAVGYLRWLLYFGGIVLLVSAGMHSVLAKSTAKSIGWVTNGFQYELSFFSFGAGLGALYAVYHSLDALIAMGITISVFLALAGLNHVKEIIAEKNYAPNNTLILIWDFGFAISVGVLLYLVA